LIVGIPSRLELGELVDVRVVGHGYRSVTAVPDPLPINGCPMAMLTAIPGIGKRRAARIVKARPMSGEEELNRVLEDQSAFEALAPLISF
jgi:radical SAM superfamily enzyme with C-terminal helix-hairpin-helix motif